MLIYNHSFDVLRIVNKYYSIKEKVTVGRISDDLIKIEFEEDKLNKKWYKKRIIYQP